MLMLQTCRTVCAINFQGSKGSQVPALLLKMRSKLLRSWKVLCTAFNYMLESLKHVQK